MLKPLKTFLPWMLLLAMGLGWGLAFSLAKMAILAGGMPFGMAFWQMVAACVMSFVICQIQRKPIPMTRQAIANYLLVSVLASAVPSSCLMVAAGRVQAGVDRHPEILDERVEDPIVVGGMIDSPAAVRPVDDEQTVALEAQRHRALALTGR